MANVCGCCRIRIKSGCLCNFIRIKSGCLCNFIFMASGEFDETRIVIAAPAAVESEDTEWVVMELGVVAD
jgi:hypothetical protein